MCSIRKKLALHCGWVDGQFDVPEQMNTYMLELPEIFSAYRLYINGTQALQMGEPQQKGYQPETGNRSVSIKTGSTMEILLAVSDYSHLYSGMVYPLPLGGLMRCLSF